MRNFFFITIFFFWGNFADASIKLEILKSLESTKNLKFKFIQKIDKKIETGECVIVYPKKIFCEYDDLFNKILVSNGKSLVINSNRHNQYYRYRLKETPLELLLNKEYLIEKIKEVNTETELTDKYLFEFNFQNNSLFVYFDKINFSLMGWKTTDIYQNKVETIISNVQTNLIIEEKIFNIQNYIN